MGRILYVPIRNIYTQNNYFSSYIDIQAISAPSNPSTNIGRIFHSSADGKLYFKKSDGTTVDLESGGGGGGGAPTDSSYITLGTDATLTAERVLTAGTNIAFVDAGAGSTLTVNVPDASEAVKGAVELATSAETTAGLAVQASDSRLSDARTPTAHASTHYNLGSDAIKLDDLATPDDNTDLNASSTRHGLLAKLSGNSTEFLSGQGTWLTPAGSGSGGGTIGGTATKSGDATTTIFTIAHGLGTTPNAVSVEPSSIDALGDYQVDFDATNITITYQSAPPTGTNNLDFVWIASVGGSGEANTYSNAGAGGVGIILTKTGVDFPFKSINTANSSNITVTNDAANSEIDLDIGSAVATLTGTQTLTNKTLTSPTINSGTTTGNFTLDSTASTFVEYQKPTGASAAENLVKWRIAESSSNYISFENASVTDGVFVPRVILRQGINSTDPGGRIHGMIQSTQDSGSIAALVLSGQTNAGALATRPILSIQNWTTEEYLFSATQADFKSNNIISAAINLTNNTVTDTSAAAGDLAKSNGTKYTRFARGTANQLLKVNSGGTDLEWGDYNNVSNMEVITVYDVYKINTTYYIFNRRTNTTTSGSDFQTLIQTELNAMTSPAYSEFNFDASEFEFNNPITIPNSNANVSIKAVVFKGWYGQNRNWGTRFKPSSTFPTTRYLIEGIGADGTNEYPDLNLSGIHFHTHPDYARSLAGTAINGGATIIDCGAIKLENSGISRQGVSISNISTSYMWRGLHLIGKLWFNRFENIHFNDSNANFSGNADLILENGNHTLDTGNPTPKGNFFRSVKASHQGQMDYFMLIKSGNYNEFIDTTAEGTAYRTAVLALDNTGDAAINSAYTIASNQFRHTTVLDTNTVPSPDNRQGTLYLNGSGVFDNIFRDSGFTAYPNTLKYANSPQNNIIEISAHWGNIPVISDTGAGVNNTIIIQGGHRSATTQTKITTSDSIVRIIDTRDNVNARNISTQSGDGTDTTFLIPHGLITTPVNYDVKPISNDAHGNFDLSVDGTNITITYAFAPPSGTNNLKWSWYADIY